AVSALPVPTLQRATNLRAAVRLLMIGVDHPVAEVAHQQIATEGAEVGRGERQSPGRVEGAPGGDTRHEVSAGVEHVDETEPGPADLVHLGSVLPRVRDEDRAVDVLDAEGRVAARNLLVDERARRAHQIEAAVEDVDAGVVEVGGIELVAGGRGGDREPLVDRTHAGAVDAGERLSRGRRRNGVVPATDDAALGGEDERHRPRMVPSLITNPLPPLKTMPVGAPGPVTTSGRT